MRVRLSLLPPFAPAKLLVPVPADIQTVKHLKRYLAKSLSAVSTVTHHGTELLLEVDGFELLSGSPLDVLDDKDIVTVQLTRTSSGAGHQAGGASASRKRSTASATPSALPRPAKKARVSNEHRRSVSMASQPIQQPPAPVQPTPPIPATEIKMSPTGPSSINKAPVSPAPSNTSSSSSSDSSDTSSSSSSDDEDDSSDEPSSSEAESRGTSLRSSPMPFPPASRQPPLPPVARPQVATSSRTAAPAPPGQGKPTTKSRNARRAIARQMRKAEAANAGGQPYAPRPLAQQSERSQPPGEQGVAATTTTYTVPGLPVPLEMANGNKKKGFLKEMLAVQGTKTVFQEVSSQPARTEPAREEEQETPFPSTALNLTPPPPTARATRRAALVPPSEQKNLPPNLFVTSQVFDWRTHDRAKAKGRGKGKDPQPNDAPAQPVAAQAEEDEDMEMEMEDGDEPITQPAGAAPTAASAIEGEDGGEKSSDDPWVLSTQAWTAAERQWRVPGGKWKHIHPGTDHSLSAGDAIAWQELALDPSSFTPELRFHLAKAMAHTDQGWLVRQYRRPYDGEDGYDGEEDDGGGNGNDAFEAGGGARPDAFELTWAEMFTPGSYFAYSKQA